MEKSKKQELYEYFMEMFHECENVSISKIQRFLNFGYPRAKQLLGDLVKENLVKSENFGYVFVCSLTECAHFATSYFLG